MRDMQRRYEECFVCSDRDFQRRLLGERWLFEREEMIIEIFLFVSVVINIALVYGIIRMSHRLFQFDDLFELFAFDIDVNVKYFENLLSTSLYESSEEVRAANKNMGIISKRLEEFGVRMKELTNKD